MLTKAAYLRIRLSDVTKYQTIEDYEYMLADVAQHAADCARVQREVNGATWLSDEPTTVGHKRTAGGAL
jgi:hypothetical protein